jgi:methionine-S-sulfoxide reductase
VREVIDEFCGCNSAQDGTIVKDEMTSTSRLRLSWLLGLVLALLSACARFSSPEPEPRVAQAPESSPNVVKPGERLETAILAGGCFWGMEEILRTVPGVVSTDVGYAGGKPNVTYEDMHHDTSGNAEAVRVVFDPAKLSYDELLEKWFFRMHDPTTPNRQGNDVGEQYRSVLFVNSPAQRATAERVKQRVDKSGVWKRPIVTQITDQTTFTRAEEYHQKYLVKNQGGYTCHYLRDFEETKSY